MSLLITGGTGYIGKRLTQKLMKKYNSIYSVGIEELDLLNYLEVLNFLKENNIKKIIHLGWKIENGNGVIYDNIEALNNLVKASEEVQVEKFIFISGNNVYGTKLNGLNFSEEDKENPDESNKYGISKYLGEELIKCTMKEKACIIRIADVYGPGQNHGNLIKTIISNVENKENIKLYGKNLSGIYNLGTGEGTSVKKIVDIVLNLCQNRIGLDYIEAENEDTSKVVLNVEKLKKLGFNYSINIKEGLKKIIEERGMSDGKF